MLDYNFKEVIVSACESLLGFLAESWFYNCGPLGTPADPVLHRLETGPVLVYDEFKKLQL